MKIENIIRYTYEDQDAYLASREAHIQAMRIYPGRVSTLKYDGHEKYSFEVTHDIHSQTN